MANNNLIAVVTMLVLMGSSGAAQQDPSINELLTIEKLIDGQDWRALYTYVQANPRLTAGNGPLASELRAFVDDAKRGLLNRFDAPPSNQTTASTATSNRGIY